MTTFDATKLQIIRHRHSTTQGVAELIYDGRSLGRFCDSARGALAAGAGWMLPEADWIETARFCLWCEGFDRGATLARMRDSLDTRTLTEALAAVGLEHQAVPGAPHRRVIEAATGEGLGWFDNVQGWALAYQREAAAAELSAKHYVVGWINPADRTQAGEFRTRNSQEAQRFADEKRAAGCDVEQLRA